MDATRKARIDKKLAFAMFKTGKTFTAFEDKAWIDFFAELGYKPLSATTIRTKLLDKAYDEIEAKVNL
jgi:hypothetical protein